MYLIVVIRWALMASLPGRHFFRNLIERRSLLYQLVQRDFERRFVGSAAGWLWGVIHPLVILLSWSFVFHYCLRMPVPEGENTDNYTIFLFCGYLPWMLFQDTVQRSATCLIDNANLITRTVFPSEMVPISIFLSSLVNHLMTVGLALGAIALVSGHLSMMSLWLPVYVILLGLLSIGIGWIVAALHVFLRDTAQVLSVVLTCWFWVTPIFMSEKQVPEGVRFLLALNPLSFLVRAYRERLLSYRPPSLRELLVVSVYAIGAFLVGALVFRQLKRGFADVM